MGNPFSDYCSKPIVTRDDAKNDAQDRNKTAQILMRHLLG
jgi:hypothetical protein